MFRQLAPSVVLDGAACVDHDPLTFDDADEWVNPELTLLEIRQLNVERRLRARVICSGCPVRQECLQWALDEEVTTGTLGGLSAGSRQLLRKGEIPRHAIPRQRTGSRPANAPGNEMVREFMAGGSLAEVAARHGVTTTTVAQRVNRAVI